MKHEEQSGKTMENDDHGMTRGQFMRRAGAGALAVSAGALLAGCGTSSTRFSSTSKGTSVGSASTLGGTPKYGGAFQVGMITSGPSETINPASAATWPDLARVVQLYDMLFTLSPDLTIVPGLATSASANKDATVWTIQLRDGVVFHDGSPFTADDVVWTIKGWSSPNHFAYGLYNGMIDFKGVKKRGRLTVEVPLVIPVAEFPAMFFGWNQGMVKNGSSVKDISRTGMGTGPFKLKSFTPGVQSVFVRNEHYWQSGKPYVDSITINTSFNDPAARVNALQSGQINVAPLLPYTNALQLSGSNQAQVLASEGPNVFYFPMRVDTGPFADPRVRLALKLIADRPALVNGTFSGLGAVANDMFGHGLPNYAESLPQRAQDIEQAKSLLKQAGQSDLAFTLPTCEAVPGFNEMSTQFASQAAQAGVKIKVDVQSTSTYYTIAGGFTRRPIGVQAFQTFPSLTYAYWQNYIPEAEINETHWGSSHPAANKLLAQTMGETNAARAKEMWLEVQRLQYNQGGDLMWGESQYIDAAAPNVRGLKTTPVAYLNYFNFNDGWVASA
jgi:peptide/nickel transport system substrate-binding protein